MIRGVALIMTLLMASPAGSAPVSGAPFAEDREPALTVAAVGDIMLGTDYPSPRLPGDDGVSLLAEIAPIVSAADVGFGNLEGVLLDGGEPVKECSDPAACYLFRSPTRYAKTLAGAGFTAMSLANNHARDFGEPGRDSSMAALASHGILHSGREGDVASWTVRGLDIAMIAFAPFKGAHDLLSLEPAAELVAGLAGTHDIVIVSMHAGGEAGDVLRVPFEEEEFRGENRGDVALFARTVVEAGADLMIGHGPHVPRGMEIYRERLIAYSLGNFATYYGIRVTGNNGLAPLLVVAMDEDGRFLGGQIHSFRQRRPAGPVADLSGEASGLIRDLSLADFPDSAPAFGAGGELLPRIPDGAQSSAAD